MLWNWASLAFNKSTVWWAITTLCGRYDRQVTQLGEHHHGDPEKDLQGSDIQLSLEGVGVS